MLHGIEVQPEDLLLCKKIHKRVRAPGAELFQASFELFSVGAAKNQLKAQGEAFHLFPSYHRHQIRTVQCAPVPRFDAGPDGVFKVAIGKFLRQLGIEPAGKAPFKSFAVVQNISEGLLGIGVAPFVAKTHKGVPEVLHLSVQGFSQFVPLLPVPGRAYVHIQTGRLVK